MTKSMCGIGLEILRDSGKISSFDAPLRQFFPEWANDLRGSITIREVMDQTSGLDPHESEYLYGDLVKQALELKLVKKPGTTWAYNNVATNLLSGVIQKASGKTPKVLLQQNVFDPLGIRDFFWAIDKDGNSPCAAGLLMGGPDLLKIGQALIGERAPPRSLNVAHLLASIRDEHVPGRPDYGLLWWKGHATQFVMLDDATIEAWSRGGVSQEIVHRLLSLKGKRFDHGYVAAVEKRLGTKGADAFWDYLDKQDLPFGSIVGRGPVVWIGALGAGGQYLLIFPRQRAVVIRQSDPSSISDFFPELPRLAQTYLVQ